MAKTQKTYTIQKVGKARVDRKESYFGPTWQQAHLWSRYKRRYDDMDEAQELADKLSKHNPAGFIVIEYQPAPR